MKTNPVLDFAVIPGSVIAEILSQRHQQIVDLVENTYRQHCAGLTVNPHSYFLRFPAAPQNRIIALPAAIMDGVNVTGIKWISSFPDNIGMGIPRASAVLILNDLQTGYPYACLEGSVISAARTAASAVLGARWMNGSSLSINGLSVIGAGLIARRIFEFLIRCGWEIPVVNVFDIKPEFAVSFCEYAEQNAACKTHVCGGYEDAIRQGDLVIFTTTAGAPYVHDADLFRHHPRVLHISLRDLGTEVIFAADNIVDDVDHCLQANTSLHLAEQQSGSREFVSGTLVDLMKGSCALHPERPVIFSPFGMGILDLAVAKFVYEIALERKQHTVVDGFLPTQRC